ncbi:hypothetical protein KJ656_17795, partial [bacterium]|nr:hypothetical protein [bacterium]
KLNVSLILEGTIRKSGNFVRITTQLIKVENGFHIWSDSWDRELKNIFILQDEIAAIIAEKINADMKSAVTTTDHVIENTDALDLYLKGIYLLNTWDFKEAEKVITYFEQALTIDPKFIKAYIGLSNCYTWLGSTGVMSQKDAQKKVEHYIKKVLALDKNLPDVYSVIAGKNFFIEWNIPLALENINKALKLKPSFFDALMYKGMILAALGRVEESLDNLFQAERLSCTPKTGQVVKVEKT